jgi:hypothetical protein
VGGNTVLTIIGSLGIPTIMTALIAFFGTRSSLKSNAPKVEAEADQVQASAAVQNLTAQSSVIATLVSENARLTERVTVLEGKADTAKSAQDDLRVINETLRRINDLMREHILHADAWIARAWSENPSEESPPAEFIFPK